MAPINPDPRTIKSFRTQAALVTWLGKHHDWETEISINSPPIRLRPKANATEQRRP